MVQMELIVQQDRELTARQTGHQLSLAASTRTIQKYLNALILKTDIFILHQ